MVDKSTELSLPIQGQDGPAVLGRIASIYGCKTKAELGRVLGMNLKAIWAAIDRKSIPYPQIVDKCRPEDWVFIFTGRRPPERSGGEITLPEMIQAVIDAGYSVEKKSHPKD